MGKTLLIKLSVLMGVLLFTCIVVYGFNEPAVITEKVSLSGILAEVPGYKLAQKLALDDSSVRMLKLDDYTFLNYSGEGGIVNLYIGFYYSASKAYAAHSPLVCYPSQGWKIDTRPVRSTLSAGPHLIRYEEIITSHGTERELVLYWYQARLFTDTQTYRNKINMGYNKLFHNDQQHGFVRVSASLRNRSYEEAKESITGFIAGFYPLFLDYIKS